MHFPGEVLDFTGHVMHFPGEFLDFIGHVTDSPDDLKCFTIYFSHLTGSSADYRAVIKKDFVLC